MTRVATGIEGRWTPAWSPPPRRPVLADDACDLWRIDLEAVASAGGGDPERSPLDAAERVRAARFVFDRHRRWYTAARTSLRTILGAYLGLEAAAVPIEVAPLGRPRLAGSDASRASAPALDFNLSHCDALALVAVARRGPLGVDVEWVRAMDDALALARRHFVADEIEQVERAEGAARDEAFFTCWTRKEAVLKSTGVGLSVAPCTVRVGATAEPLQLDFRAAHGAVPVELHSFQVRDGAAGACAFVPGTRLVGFYELAGADIHSLAGNPRS